MEKPDKKYVYITVHEGKYDILHPDDIQYCYVFHNLPANFKSRYIIDKYIEEYDTLELALELQNRINKYLYNDDKDKIKVVVNWLKEHYDEQSELENEYNIKLCKYKIEHWNEQLKKYETKK